MCQREDVLRKSPNADIDISEVGMNLRSIFVWQRVECFGSGMSRARVLESDVFESDRRKHEEVR